MDEEKRQKVLRIIRRWDDRTFHQPDELVAELREAGFPIVAWDDVIRGYGGEIATDEEFDEIDRGFSGRREP